jgi:hypothetical protein
MLKQFILLLICILFMAFGCAQNLKEESQTGAKAKTYTVGDTGPSGVGIVFYISDGGLHGLEAAPAGLADPTSVWIMPASKQTLINAHTSMYIGTGSANTRAISSQAGLVLDDYAAKLCNFYSGGGKTDWFLPSKDELYELYMQKDVVGGFDGSYWSSSENSNDRACVQNFGIGGYQYNELKSYPYKVRAVRAF